MLQEEKQDKAWGFHVRTSRLVVLFGMHPADVTYHETMVVHFIMLCYVNVFMNHP